MTSSSNVFNIVTDRCVFQGRFSADGTDCVSSVVVPRRRETPWSQTPAVPSDVCASSLFSC